MCENVDTMDINVLKKWKKVTSLTLHALMKQIILKETNSIITRHITVKVLNFVLIN